MDITILMIILLAVIILYMIMRNKENFDIPVGKSSAWDWNTGPGYGAGYGTGYAMWGIWPDWEPAFPWKPWMWRRRPSVFVKPFTAVPQIDYNDALDETKATSNYYVSIIPGSPKFSFNGISGSTLQLDRDRMYYFHIYSPGVPYMFTLDGHNSYIGNPIEVGTITVRFDENTPDRLYYMSPGKPETGGVVYLNDIRGRSD